MRTELSPPRPEPRSDVGGSTVLAIVPTLGQGGRIVALRTISSSRRRVGSSGGWALAWPVSVVTTTLGAEWVPKSCKPEPASCVGVFCGGVDWLRQIPGVDTLARSKQIAHKAGRWIRMRFCVARPTRKGK